MFWTASGAAAHRVKIVKKQRDRRKSILRNYFPLSQVEFMAETQL